MRRRLVAGVAAVVIGLPAGAIAASNAAPTKYVPPCTATSNACLGKRIAALESLQNSTPSTPTATSPTATSPTTTEPTTTTPTTTKPTTTAPTTTKPTTTAPTTTRPTSTVPTTTVPSTSASTPPGQIIPLTPGTSWQWQIDGGTIDQTALNGSTNPRKMFDIDMENTPASTITSLQSKGIVVICYMETGSWESYRSDAVSFPDSVKGATMDGYPDEKYVDIRQVSVLRPIMDKRLDAAKAKGCDGIEPDIDDSWQESTGFPLTLADQLTYNGDLIADAHSRGMSMGQKNGPVAAFTKGELAAGADWALSEQCNQYDECGADGGNYASYISAGKAVFQVEYSLTTAQFCAKDNAANFDGIKKEVSLGATPRTACRLG